MRRRLALAVLLGGLALGAWAVAGPYGRAAALLVLATDLSGWPRAISRLHARPVARQTVEIPTRAGPVPAHRYHPEHGGSLPVVLVSGVHPDGIEDPRLMHFARSLAAVGFGVTNPELPLLRDFEIGPAATDLIEDVASWVIAQDGRRESERAGLIGISFSGGLAIVAAGRDSIRDHVAFVLSIGGHGDLPRTLDTLTGGILTDDPDATTDVFGLAIVLASVAPRVVPSEQAPALHEWARTYLTAAHLPLDDPQRAALLSQADRLFAELPQPARALVEHARAGDSAALRPHLLHHVRELAEHPSLSPERAPAPRAPVYLLHGTDDPVIPPEESRRLGAHLRPLGEVRVLLTPLLTHADLEADLPPRDVAALLAFLGSLMRQ